MDVADPDAWVSNVAAAIAEPARTRMLYSLLDGHARTGTELGIIAGVNPSTASVHLARLKAQRLVKMVQQGKYRYYSLEGPSVAAALEALNVVAGRPSDRFVPNTPTPLRAARTCYDHMAGQLAVSLHDRILERGWLSTSPSGAYDVTPAGARRLGELGLDVKAVRTQRRRFAYACLDWSERRMHIAGALGAALLEIALRRQWVIKEGDSRALRLTHLGRRVLQTRFGVHD